ncbi:SAM-dependent methyltransferase [soil metagenome]
MNRMALDYFENVYAKEPDPWGFDARFYESRKYALTLAALPRERFARAFEPGCANGALSEKLALRCDALISTELVPRVANRARERLSVLPNVDVRVMAVPDAWPEGVFDLIVLSEVVYYLSHAGVSDLLRRIDASLVPGGHVIAVHWRGKTDYPLRGDEAHERLDRHPAWRRSGAWIEPEFLLSTYENLLP